MNSKRLLLVTSNNCFLEYDIKDKNSKGKKHKLFKLELKNANKKLRKKNKINILEYNIDTSAGHPTYEGDDIV